MSGLDGLILLETSLYKIISFLNRSNNKKNIFPAMEVKIGNLDPIKSLLEDHFRKPVCQKCGNSLCNNLSDIVLEDLMGYSYIRYQKILCTDCLHLLD